MTAIAVIATTMLGGVLFLLAVLACAWLALAITHLMYPPGR